MSRIEAWAFETLAGKLLSDLGYPLSSPGSGPIQADDGSNVQTCLEEALAEIGRAHRAHVELEAKLARSENRRVRAERKLARAESLERDGVSERFR